MSRKSLAVCLAVVAISVLIRPAATRADGQYPLPYPPPPLPFPDVIVRAGDLEFQVEPQHAQVFVDGYYSGAAGDYSGFLHHLHVPPGNRRITLYLDGYRTVSQNVSVSPGSTYKLHYAMEKLAPGAVSEHPPAPANAPPPQAPPMRSFPEPPMPRAAPPPPETASPFGTLVIRVQPAGAEILIDGDHWNGPEGEERLLIQIAEGRHRIEIFKDGFKRFSTEIEIHRGETMPLNVSLPPDEE